MNIVTRLLIGVMVCAFTLAGCSLAGRDYLLQGGAPTKNSGPPIWPPPQATFHYTLGMMYALDGDFIPATEAFQKALEADPQSPEIATELMATLTEAGNINRALAIGEEMAKHAPESLDLNMLLGGLYVNAGQFANAITCFRRVISIDPTNTLAHLYLGMAYSELKDFPRALESFERVLAREPNHLLALYWRGRVLMQMGRLEEAVAVFKKILTLKPDHDAALIELVLIYERQNKPTAAIDVMTEFLAKYPRKTQVRMKLGELLLREKRYADAEREFLRVLRASPDNREVRLTLGLLYLESGNADQAIEAFSYLRRAYPEDHRFLYLEAAAYEGKKDFMTAIRRLEDIPVTSDLFGSARIRIASLLKQEGRTSEAVETIRRALAQKKEAGLYIYLSSLQEEGKDIAGAIDTLKQGIASLPGKEDLHYALGVLYEKQKNHEAAIEQMERVLQINPANADALNFIGYSYADRGIHLDKAEKLLRRAMELKPDSGYIVDSVGWLYFKQKNYPAALEYLGRALDLLPDDPAINEHMGDVLAAMHRFSEALTYYEKALWLDPKNEPLKKKIDTLKKSPKLPR